ncbi:MAG: hypothetical protein WA913_17280 [Pricia sp.]
MTEARDFIWLIRSAGERTAQHCLHLVQDIAPEHEVHFIEEEPFNQALVKGFGIAEASSAKWMVCIDADVLLYRKGILELLEVARRAEEDVCYVQGLTIDRFIPIIRSAGNGIYRTSVASQAKSLVPRGDSSNRPETTTMQGLLAAGYKMYRTNIVVGIHDYGQYYRDIYRKVFLHTHKHKNVIGEVGRYWESLQNENLDFKVARAAMKISSTYSQNIPVSKSFKQQEAQKALFFMDLTEKEALATSEFNQEDIASIVQNFKSHEALQQKKFPEYSKNYFVSPPQSKKLPKFARKGVGYAGGLAVRWGPWLTEWGSD